MDIVTDQRLSTQFDITKNSKSALGLIKFFIIFQKESDNGSLALFRHHDRNLTWVLLNKLIIVVVLPVEAYFLQWIRFLHTHMDVILADDDVIGSDLVVIGVWEGIQTVFVDLDDFLFGYFFDLFSNLGLKTLLSYERIKLAVI